MAYMVERNSKGKPFQNQWLFESHLRSFGYFWVSLSALASSGPQLQKQLAYKSWLGTSGPDCHLTPKTEHLQKRKLHSNPRYESDWSKNFSLNFSCFSPTFSKNTPFSRFYLTAVNPADDTESCRIFSNYFSNIVSDRRISNLFDK